MKDSRRCSMSRLFIGRHLHAPAVNASSIPSARICTPQPGTVKHSIRLFRLIHAES